MLVQRLAIVAGWGVTLMLLSTPALAVSVMPYYDIRPSYTTADDPANHVVPSGGTLDGVGDLIISRTDGTFRCSSSLLPTGRHILTAAHCITDSSGVVNSSSATVKFQRDSGNTIIDVTGFNKHPDWDGDFFRGNDVAVLELDTVAPEDVDRYDIYRGNSEVDSVADKAGYGRSGTGDTGDTLGSGTKRAGQNLYDSLADTMLDALGFTAGVDYVPGSVVQYDFDNGLPNNDAFGFFFGIVDLGLGADEVLAAPGDSGGPSFLDGLIAGVTSYGVRLQFTGGASSDIDSELNSTFGEFGADTRVSTYSSFIDDLLTPVPVPAPLYLLVSGLAGLGAMGRRRRRD